MTPASLNRGCFNPSVSREDSSESLRTHGFAPTGEAMSTPGAEPKFTDPQEQNIKASPQERGNTATRSKKIGREACTASQSRSSLA
jgi:hypothetical protein